MHVINRFLFSVGRIRCLEFLPRGRIRQVRLWSNAEVSSSKVSRIQYFIFECFNCQLAGPVLTGSKSYLYSSRKMSSAQYASLKEKVVLITGASSGIGAGTARVFAKSGARLALCGRQESNLKKVSEECTALGACEVKSLLGDITDLNCCKKIIYDVIEHYGQLDVLFPGVLAYCMSKSAVDQFTRCAALELASKGIRVNAVNPGVIKTEVHKRGGMSEAEYEKFLERGKQTHALGRVGEPEEVGNAIAFLASNESSFITGETLPVDGGRHAMCPR